MGNSFTNYTQTNNIPVIPSAIVSDGIAVWIPIYAMTQMTLAESYSFPPIGSTGMRAIIQTHDDTITLRGSLVGDLRYTWKTALELLADSTKRGSTYVNGVLLVTGMTIRTEMQIQSLVFDNFSAKRHSLDLTLTMVHMPRPKNTIGKLIDAAGSIAIGALGDVAGN
jgi:hypothetical protein